MDIPSQRASGPRIPLPHGSLNITPLLTSCWTEQMSIVWRRPLPTPSPNMGSRERDANCKWRRTSLGCPHTFLPITDPFVQGGGGGRGGPAAPSRNAPPTLLGRKQQQNLDNRIWTEFAKQTLVIPSKDISRLSEAPRAGEVPSAHGRDPRPAADPHNMAQGWEAMAMQMEVWGLQGMVCEDLGHTCSCAGPGWLY